MENSRIAMVIALVLLVAIPTAAVTVLDTGSQDEISDDIIAAPSESPNGAYAYIDNDTDEIVVDLTANNDQNEGSGVPPEALTGISGVFTLTYTGDEFAEVWLEHDSDHVEFYDNEGDSIEGQENNVTLSDEGDTVHVGFQVNTTDVDAVDPLIDEMEIHAQVPDDEPPSPPPAPPAPPEPEPPEPRWFVDVDENFRSVLLLNAEVGVGETIDLEKLQIGEHATLEDVTITRAEEKTITSFDVDARHEQAMFDSVDDALEETGAIPIGSYYVADAPDPEELESVEYKMAIERDFLEGQGLTGENVVVNRYGDDGEWEAVETKVVDEIDDEILVSATFDSFSLYVLGIEAPQVVIQEATLEPDELEVGETATVEATLVNDGETDADVDVDLLIDDDTTESETTTLAAGESMSVAFEYTPTESGIYDVSLAYAYTMEGDDEVVGDGKVEVGQLEVVEVEPVEPEEPEEPEEEPIEEPGAFGLFETILVVAALAAALGALWYYRFREE